MGDGHLDDTEKAMYNYDHLGGEAKYEIKYQSQAEKKDFWCILEILQKIY